MSGGDQTAQVYVMCSNAEELYDHDEERRSLLSDNSVLIPQDAFSCVAEVVYIPGSHEVSQVSEAKPITGARRTGPSYRVTKLNDSSSVI